MITKMMSLKMIYSTHRLIAFLVVASLSALHPMQANGASETIVGIHIRLQATHPQATKSIEVTQDALKPTCARMGAAYQLTGNLADIGVTETDMFYAPALKMQARRTTTHTLLNTALCKYEVSPSEKWKIRQFSATGYTDYELKTDRKKGTYWLRSVHQMVRPQATASLLMDSMLSEATVSPVLGSALYAGTSCKIRNVSLGKGVENTLCLAATGLPYPAEVSLANKSIWGGQLMLDEEATKVDMKAVLPLTYFFLPKGEKIIDRDDQARSADNPTQKWCRAQKAKTGVNPCEDEGDEK